MSTLLGWSPAASCKCWSDDRGVSLLSKVCIALAVLIMAFFFTMQTLIVAHIIAPSYATAVLGYACIIAFTPPFGVFVYEFVLKVNAKERLFLKEIIDKNTYLEHAAKILRHDMRSGIKIYMPRGIRALERRLSPEQIAALRLEAPLKLLKEGLEHTQKVYEGVYEFTNLVRPDASLHRDPVDLREILEDFLQTTAYRDQVRVGPLGRASVNPSLFCTAIDNLIRNGLIYNDSPNKLIEIRACGDDAIAIIDNGRGMSADEFEEFTKPYVRKSSPHHEDGSGLGLNICKAILNEHGFSITCHPQAEGTLLKVKVR